jgi:V8-like Glu-specific endopeptidase
MDPYLELRHQLAERYPRSDDALGIARSAGIDASDLVHEGQSSIGMWDRLLRAARHQHRWEVLAYVVVMENPALAQLVAHAKDSQQGASPREQWTRDMMISLRSILATYYPLLDDARRFAKEAGLNTTHISLSAKAITNWFNIIEYAGNQGKIDALLELALLEYPGDDKLKRLKAGMQIPMLEGPEPVWRGPSAVAELERIIGAQSTLVPISYFELGLLRSRSVVRVRLPDGSSGTGFVIDNNFLVTNHHVLRNLEEARTAVIEFNYQKNTNGLDAPIEECSLDPETYFRTSEKQDWTVVHIKGNPSAKWGTLPMGRARLKVGDHVNIIQHAGGGTKQVSFFANVVAYVDNVMVQYLTDTLPGSSGSPVFDTNWNLVAIHHSGGWVSEPNIRSKNTYYRNQGTLIDCIIDGIASS